MSQKHYIKPTGPSTDSDAVQLGSAANLAGNMTFTEIWKLVKFTASDTYDLAAAGDLIEGAITSIEPATSAGWTIGGVNKRDKMTVLADGLQATPGTGVIAAGDYVVTGSVTAKGTALPSYAKVTKATVQPGDVPGTLTAAAAQVKASLFAWRVVSLLGGAGAVGTPIVIERVGR